MRRVMRVVFAASLIAGTVAAQSGAPQSAASRARIGQLAWLAGCWEQSVGGRTVEEQWMRPRGGLMLGAGRTVAADSLVEFEQVRIFERAGRLVYGARPSGQTPAEFESVVLTDSSVTFENLAHDFPQRVIYRRAGADSIVGRVEATRNGRARGVDFPYRRVGCTP